MTEQHPITPPPELVQQWRDEAFNLMFDGDYPCPFDIDEAQDQHITTQAARWGADKELEACLQWFSEFYCMETWMQKDLEKFRAARRPKPPSLKEQALKALNSFEGFTGSLEEVVTIRHALEQLDD